MNILQNLQLFVPLYDNVITPHSGSLESHGNVGQFPDVWTAHMILLSLSVQVECLMYAASYNLHTYRQHPRGVIDESSDLGSYSSILQIQRYHSVDWCILCQNSLPTVPLFFPNMFQQAHFKSFGCF